MSNFGDKVQPAVKKETKNVAIYTVVGVVVMWVGFLILHLIWPEKIPFDYRVILGGIGGGAVAVLNFFLMGMAVQKAVSETDEAGAKRRMQASYSQRNLMQMLWAVLAIVLPCFQFAAGIQYRGGHLHGDGEPLLSGLFRPDGQLAAGGQLVEVLDRRLIVHQNFQCIRGLQLCDGLLQTQFGAGGNLRFACFTSSGGDQYNAISTSYSEYSGGRGVFQY